LHLNYDRCIVVDQAFSMQETLTVTWFTYRSHKAAY